MFLYHLSKGKHINSDRNDYLAKFLQHIYSKNVKMHFVELLIYAGIAELLIYFAKLFLLH